MIDWKRVNELRFEIGDEGFSEVVELFLDEVEGTVIGLASADATHLEADLHFLKGCAWNLGFADFGGLCQDGERKAAAGHATQIDCGRITARYFTARAQFLAGLAEDGIGAGARTGT